MANFDPSITLFRGNTYVGAKLSKLLKKTERHLHTKLVKNLSHNIYVAHACMAAELNHEFSFCLVFLHSAFCALVIEYIL